MDESYFNRKIPATNASSAPKICSSPRLVSQVSGISGQNTKIKYLMCHIHVEILEHYVIPNSSNQNLEICARKYRKTSKDE